MGLIRGIARTAAIAGTATAVSNRVSRRQAGRWAAKEQKADEEQQAQYAQQQPQYAQPQPQYAQPQYAQPQYAQPQYAQPQYAQPQYAQPPAAPSTDDMLEQLQKLGELKKAGVLTEAEFQAQKAKILAG